MLCLAPLLLEHPSAFEEEEGDEFLSEEFWTAGLGYCSLNHLGPVYLHMQEPHCHIGSINTSSTKARAALGPSALQS